MNDIREFVNRLGESDTLFTGPYQASHFDHTYQKHQQCSEQIMTLQFDKKYFYGDDTQINIYRNGDILQALYLQLTFATPGIPVVDSLGTYAIEYARLLWDGQLIEEIRGEHLEMVWDLTVPQSKQGSLGQLIGKNRTTMNNTYSIKLPFDCFKRGFPLCALKSDPYLQIKFRPASSFAPSITGPLQLDAKLLVKYVFLPSNQVDYLKNNPLTYMVEQTHQTNIVVPPSTLAGKTNTIRVSSNVITTGVSGASERYFGVPVPYDFIAHLTSNITVRVTSSPATTSNFTILLNGVSATVSSSSTGGVATFVYTGALTYGTTANVAIQWTSSETPNLITCTFAGSYSTNECQPVTVLTSFVHPVKELFIAIQNENTTSSYDYTYDGVNDQLVSMRMVFNGHEVIPATLGTPIFLRTLQGLENYTRSPDRKFYLYPFALDPENSLPTGSINMSALTRQQFDFALRYTTTARNIRMYARLHNVMTVNKGELKVLFTEISAASTLSSSGVGRIA